MKHSRYSFVATLLLGSSVLVGCGAVPPSSPQVPAATGSPSTSSGEKMPPTDGGGMGMMKQEAAPELTDAQKTQLATGTAAHEPASLTFNIAAGSYYFVPNVIRVKKGDKVKIVLENKGGMHNFVLDEFNVMIDPIKMGETSTAEFVADKVGTFEYYCGVGSHRKMGQKGNLIVE